MRREYWPTKQWRWKEPEALGMDAGGLFRLKRLLSEKYSRLNGFILIRDGYLAYEQYAKGCTAQTLHPVASVTKSVLSAVVGVALDKGWLDSLDQRVLDFFPEYNFSEGEAVRGRVTLRHLLTMTAPHPFRGGQEPIEELCAQKDWVGYILTRLGQGGALGRFQYSSAGTHLLSAVMTRCTGRNVRAIADEFLFQPMGMRPIVNGEACESVGVGSWQQDPQGNTTGGWGLSLTLRDMARFGFLYLNRGVWNYQELVSREWVASSTTINHRHYGYLWWLFEQDGITAYAAMGQGGNMICCVPQLDLVVVTAAVDLEAPRELWRLVYKHIFPMLK